MYIYIFYRIQLLHVGSINENAYAKILDAKSIYFALRMQSEFREKKIILIHPVQCIPFFFFSLVSVSFSEDSVELIVFIQ